MQRTKIYPICLFLFGFLTFSLSPALRADNSGFVEREGDHLKLNDEAFFFSSANQYYLFYKSNPMIDEVLEDANSLGMKVFRTWGFCEGRSFDGYCFQPFPGQYDEPTFQKMDYVINKANQENIRLIIPLVNNWDDGFGGMEQYAAWSPSAKANLDFHLYNPDGVNYVVVAIATGPNSEWHESTLRTLVPGDNYMFFDLSASNWRTAANNWQPVSPISNLDQVRRFYIGIYGYNGPGSIYVDDIRVGPPGQMTLWDGAEQIGNWIYESGFSDATNISLSTEHVIEGTYSFKFDYRSNTSGKAFWSVGTSLGNHDAFYVDATAKQMYKNYVAYFLNRVNSITQVAYKDDPTIMAWELANEPRLASDLSGDTFQAWVEEMSAYIKSIDSNHLVSIGSEGWYQSQNQGTDFIRNHQSSNIDICSFHLFPNDNQMTEYDAENSILRHINDAKTLIGKPVYAGEFGWKVNRNAQRSSEQLLHDFSSSSETWYNQWGYSSDPIRVSDPSYNGNGAVKMEGSFSSNGTAAAAGVWYATPKNLSGHQYIAGWVRTPAFPSGTYVQLQLYTKSGPPDRETWSPTVEGYLSPETWYQVKLNVSDFHSPANPADVKFIGMQFKTFNTNYTGDVYYDLVEAYTGSDINFSNQMAVRNRLYEHWYDLVDNRNADGAGFWLLSGHDENNNLYPDYDNYTVYHPEDVETSTVIQNFSNSMNDKRWILQLPVTWYQEENNYYSASAVSKMILDYIRQDTVLTQSELYTYGHDRNHSANSDILDVDPQGVEAVLNQYSPQEYHFSIRALNQVTDIMRDILHWMDYEVPGVPVPRTPVAVPTFGGYGNWMVAIGGVASVDPLPNPSDPWYTPDFTVHGFFLNDPAVSGIGAKCYKTAAECQMTYFLPLASGTDPWNGKYVSVAEPPEHLSDATVIIADSKITDTTQRLTRLGQMGEARELENFPWRDVIDPVLMKNIEFRHAYKGSIPGRPIKVKRIDRKQSDYYLIPFKRPESGGASRISVVVIVDAQEGFFKEASWTNAPSKYPAVTADEAIALALKKRKSAIVERMPRYPITAELVWGPAISSSPYYPVWRVRWGDKAWFVNQKGSEVSD